jgi:hypothetical protein
MLADVSVADQTAFSSQRARAHRPTKKPPFLVAQLVVMAIFIVIGFRAVKSFRIEPIAAPEAWRSTKASLIVIC